MKPITELRGRTRIGTAGWLLLSAALAFLLAAGGCGELNDDPNQSTLGVTVGFKDDGSSTSSSSEPNAQSPGISSPPPPDEQVLSLVVGAIVITHEKVPGNGIQPYTSADIGSLSNTQRELLENDAEQSVVYLEIVPLPSGSDFVEFNIPPDNAGPWQLIAVGLRHSIEALDEIRDDSPIYYGFIGEFLNNQVTPGGVVTQELLLEPACALAFKPVPPCPP